MNDSFPNMNWILLLALLSSYEASASVFKIQKIVFENGKTHLLENGARRVLTAPTITEGEGGGSDGEERKLEAEEPAGGKVKARWLGFGEKTTTTTTTTPAPTTSGGYFSWIFGGGRTTTQSPAIETTTEKGSGGFFGLFDRAINSTKNVVKETGSIIVNPMKGIEVGKGLVQTALNTTGKVVKEGGKLVTNIVTIPIDVALFAVQGTANVCVDLILAAFRVAVRVLNKNILHLPDIEADIAWKTSFAARNGSFHALTSILKDGKLLVKRNGTSICVDTPIKFDNISVHFDHYEVTTFGVGPSGSAHIGIHLITAFFRLCMKPSLRCAINLEQITMTSMENLSVDLTGFVGSVATSVMEPVIYFLSSTIQSTVQNEIDAQLRKILANDTVICSRFLGT